MARDLEQETRNKALVLEAFDALFNRRDFEAAAKYFSPTYIQHSAGIAPGRDGLFSLVRGLTRRYKARSQSPRASTSWCTGASVGVGGRPGSSSTSSVSWTDVSQNIGTSCKTSRRRPNRRAASPCSARRFRNDTEGRNSLRRPDRGVRPGVDGPGARHRNRRLDVKNAIARSHLAA